MAKKYMMVFIGCTAIAITSIAVRANTVTCPVIGDIVCTGSRWSVTGDNNWASPRNCTTGKVATSFIGAATLTTYYSDKSTFASGPFTGNYIPLILVNCVYATNDPRGHAAISYSGTGKGSKSAFTSSLEWIYQTSSYKCTSHTSSDCALTTM